MASRRRPPADVASASNFVDFGLRHFHLDLRVNFALKEMSGWLVLDLLPLVAGARTLVLDAHPSLAVRAVDCQTGGAREPARLSFRLEPFAGFGSALQIDLPEAVEVGTPTRVTVRYAATDGPAVRARADAHAQTHRGTRQPAAVSLPRSSPTIFRLYGKNVNSIAISFRLQGCKTEPWRTITPNEGNH